MLGPPIASAVSTATTPSMQGQSQPRTAASDSPLHSSAFGGQLISFRTTTHSYFMETDWHKTVDKDGPTTYYDPADGKPLFIAPKNRSFEDFLKESKAHGWPSFRDDEVVWDNVRCLPNGEAVSLAGTHLGHNLPDGKGNRYCINLVSCAGNPSDEAK